MPWWAQPISPRQRLQQAQVAQTPLTTGTTPSAIATGDFNGDGIPDAAVANSGSGTVTVMLGVGDGTFSAGTTINTGGNPTSSSRPT